MKPTSIRLTEEENEVLQTAAKASGTTIGHIVRAAAIKLAQGMGAPKNRDSGTASYLVELWPPDIKALSEYRAKQGTTDQPMNQSVRAAMRVGLQQRGHLTPPSGVTYD